MKLDKNNRGVKIQHDSEMQKISNKELQQIFDDIQTFDNITSGRFGVFLTDIQTFFNESLNDMKHGLELFDKKLYTGGYGYLKSAGDILLCVLFIFGNKKDDEVRKARLESGKKETNFFQKMIKNNKEWKNFSVVYNEFPSFQKKQHISDKRIDRYRHKHSIRYFETVHRDWTKKGETQRLNDSIEDTRYMLSMFLLTGIIIDPSLLVVSTEDGEIRFPDIMSAFPTIECLSKYLPEITNDFVSNLSITKDLFKEIKDMYLPTQEQSTFKGYQIISNNLEIKKEQRNNFSDHSLIIYDAGKNGNLKDATHCILYGTCDIYTIESMMFSYWSNNMWTKDGRPGAFFANLKKEGCLIETVNVKEGNILLINDRETKRGKEFLKLKSLYVK